MIKDYFPNYKNQTFEQLKDDSMFLKKIKSESLNVIKFQSKAKTKEELIKDIENFIN